MKHEIPCPVGKKGHRKEIRSLGARCRKRLRNTDLHLWFIYQMNWKDKTRCTLLGLWKKIRSSQPEDFLKILLNYFKVFQKYNNISNSYF